MSTGRSPAPKRSLRIYVNGYPHGKHTYHKTSAKYRHGPETRTAAKKPYNSEDDRPYYNNADDVSAEHGKKLFCSIKVDES